MKGSRIDEIKKEQDQEVIKTKHRLNELNLEIENWPEWKKKCNSWIVIKK